MNIDYTDLLIIVSSIAEDEGFTTLEELYSYLESNSTNVLSFETLEDWSIEIRILLYCNIGGHFVREYIPLKTPDDMQEGLMFSFATGKQLDVYGEMAGLKRRMVIFIKEPDFLYKIRLKNFGIKQKTNV